MSQPNNQPPITIEVPATTSNYTQLPHTPQESRMEDFRRGWVNALALPDNFTDLIYDICLTLTISALVSSAWNNLPLPGFIRWGMIGVLIVTALTIWHLLEIPEVRGMLVFRLVLVGMGVMLGL